MSLPVIDIVGFRGFTTPEFDDLVKYPDSVVALAYDYAVDSITNYSCLDPAQLQRALWALMAHSLLRGAVGGAITGNGFTPSASSIKEIEVGGVSIKKGDALGDGGTQSDADTLDLNSTSWGKWYLGLTAKCKRSSLLLCSSSILNMRIK